MRSALCAGSCTLRAIFALIHRSAQKIGILRSLNTRSCIGHHLKTARGSLLLCESTPGDRLPHLVVLNRYAGSRMLHYHTGGRQGADHARFLRRFLRSLVRAVLLAQRLTSMPSAVWWPPKRSSASSDRGQAGYWRPCEVL